MSFSGDLYPSVASKVMTTTGDLVRFDSQRERYGIGSTNQVLTVVGGLPAWASAGHVTQSRALEVACSDETTAITVADNLIKFRMPFGLELNDGEDGVRGSLSTAGGTSDARFIKKISPCVEFGLVGKTMHKIDEKVSISDLKKLKKIYLSILLNYF